MAPDAVLAGWHEFFLAAAGATAALAGLVVVAVSVNVARILEFRQLPARAGAAVTSLVLALVVSLSCLAEQPRPALATELVVLGLLGWLVQLHATRLTIRSGRELNRPRYEAWLTLVRGQALALPFVAAGVLLALDSSAAGYLLLAGIIASVVLPMHEAWILLVEILR